MSSPLQPANLDYCVSGVSQRWAPQCHGATDGCAYICLLIDVFVLADCDPTPVTPTKAPTQFSCKTTNGPFTGGTFTFRVPASAVAVRTVSNTARAIATFAGQSWTSADATAKIDISANAPVVSAH